MNELALFAGAGGGILAGHMLGFRCVCAVEIDEYARRVLLARQDDGSLGPFPIWDDIKTFDAVPWRGIVEVVSGGFPCTDISVAGRGAGIDGEASGLWAHMARVVRDVRPRLVFVENSPALTTRGLGRVLGDMAALGYDAEWGVLGADDVGAPHRRDRFWIVAHSDRVRELQPQWHEQEERRRPRDGGADMGDADCARLAQRESEPGNDGAQRPALVGAGRWSSEPDVGRVAHGVAARVDRLRCLGNGQVPQCAAEAFTQLAKRGGWIA